MSDKTRLQERLNRLKKEREARSKSQIIKDEWSKLQQNDGVSTREKLEQLIQLRREKQAKPKPAPPPAADREPLTFTEIPYNLDARYGKITIADGLKISGDILACLSREPEFNHLDLSTALFFDLETTGLSGGTGVVPFNIGLGYYRDDKFWVGQYFLGEPAAEEKMLLSFSEFIKDMDFKSIVSYNGKVYDVPLMETRYVLQRLPCPLSSLPHLDFLFPARTLWKHKHESCRLFHLARQVLQTGRDEDIPSAEIPWRYFQFLQTGNYDLIEPILYHNAEDILSLLGIVIMGASVFSEDRESFAADGMDLFGAGKVLERLGDADKATDFFERALNGSLTDEVGLSTRRRLSLQYKKQQAWEKAVELWREMALSQEPSSDLLFSLRELSMYFEHREKEFTEAHKMAEEGYVVSLGFSAYYEKDFTRRRERLKTKIRAQECPDKPDKS